jgi:hypothetical protein
MARQDTETRVLESDADRVERLRRYAEHLVSVTTDPLMKEKIATILAGRSVNH